jgi:hypothetical protein
MKEFEKLSDAGNQYVDAFVQDIVSSQMMILGVAYGDHQFNAGIKNATRNFSVKIAGIAQIRVHDYMPIGSFAQAIPPARSDFKNSNGKWKLAQGEDIGKIPLKVVPVTPDDLGNFVCRLMNRHIFGVLPKMVDPVLNATTDHRTLATYQTAKALANFAKTAGLLFLCQALKYDLVAPSRNFRQATKAGAGGAFDEANYRGMNTDVLRATRKQLVGTKPEHVRGALGHTLWFGNENGRFDYPIKDDYNVQNNLGGELLPEEACTIIARGIGLLGGWDAPNGNGGAAIAPNRGEKMATELALNRNMAQERADFAHMTDDFLKSMFLSHKLAGLQHPREFEFGSMDYAALGGKRHVGRATAANADFVQGINRRTMAGRLLDIQLNVLCDVLRGIQNVQNVQRARIIGRVTKAGSNGGMADVYLNGAI